MTQFANQQSSPVQAKGNDDGTFTVYYFGKIVGVIKPYQSRIGFVCFRAITMQDHIRHFETFDAAKKFLTDHGV